MHRVLLSVILLFSATTIALADKPNWPAKPGFSRIGFGLIEVIPPEGGGQVTFEYFVPATRTQRIASGQIVVFPATLAAEFDEIPTKNNLIGRAVEKKSEGGDLIVTVTVTVNEPQLIVVAYGPYQGMFTFAESGPEPYKISADSKNGTKFEWVDHDAGDLTIFDFSDIEGLSDSGEIIAFDIIRDKNKMLNMKETFSIRQFILHPDAQRRVELIDANW